MSDLNIDAPPEDPAKRKGADDPFELLDPDDLLGIRPVTDPYVPKDPALHPTINGGILPPPPVPPIGPSEPPGRVKLRSAMQRCDARAAQVSDSPNDVQRLARNVLPGRNELGGHWTATVALLVANERARVATGDTPDFDRIDRLEKVIATHNEFAEALSAWCVARDALPADEGALAAELSQATDALNRLKAGLDGQGFDATAITSALDLKVQTIRLFAEASLKRMNDEAAMILSGARVPRSAPSEGMAAVLSMGIGDKNFQDRLSRAKTWGAAGTALELAIGAQALKTPVSRATGPIDLTRATRELAALDTSLHARKYAADPTEATIQAEVYDNYLAVIDAHTELLQKIRPRAAGSGSKAEWAPAKAREVTDMLVGMLRTVEADLAADALMQDPTFAARARDIVDRIAGLSGPTALEVDSEALGADLRKVWKDAKTKELAELKTARVDTKKLSTVFDGLGPNLDTWTAEVAKFPRHDRDALRTLTAQVAATLSSYRTAIEATAGPVRSSNLVHALDTVASAMVRQLRSFDARGGLF